MENEVKYNLNGLSNKQSKKMLRFFETRYKCDVSFKTNDNLEIKAHMVILESASEYFTTMFNTDLKDSRDEFVISTIDGPIFKTIIRSLYSSEITVTNENCMELYEAAHLMILNEIATACSQFMCQNVKLENCLKFLSFAQVYPIENVIEVAVEFIFKNFAQVVRRNEFLNLPVRVMTSILSGTGVHSPREEMIFEAFKNWVQYDSRNRTDYVNELITLIRLPLMKKEYFWETVDKWILTNMQDQFVYRNVGKWHAVQEIDSTLNHMTIGRKYENTIIFVKSRPNTIGRSFSLNFFDKEFKENAIVNHNVYLYHHQVLLEQDYLYVFCGYYQILYIFDLMTSSLVISNNSGFYSGYARDTSPFKVCHYKNHLYIFETNQSKLGVKRYNIKENKFVNLSQVNNNVTGQVSSATVFNDKIYLVEESSPNLLKMYHNERQLATLVSRIDSISGNCRLAVAEDVLYAVADNKTIGYFKSNDKSFKLLYSGGAVEYLKLQSVCVKKKKIFASYKLTNSNKFKVMEFNVNEKKWKNEWIYDSSEYLEIV